MGLRGREWGFVLLVEEYSVSQNETRLSECNMYSHVYHGDSSYLFMNKQREKERKTVSKLDSMITIMQIFTL